MKKRVVKRRAHVRRTKRGKVNVRKHKMKTRYTTSTGRFKPMTTPGRGTDKKSRFGGCVRSMQSRGYSLDSSRKICAAIARRKGR